MVGVDFLTTGAIRALNPRGDEDFADRLNSYYTVSVLFVCFVIVSAQQFVGRPIQCYVPPSFTSSMEQYIENFCWIQNTYWLPLYEQIPDEISAREAKQIGYYQWVPFILALEALMFSLPTAMWRMTNWQSGINVRNIVNAAIEAQSQDTVARSRAIEILARNIEEVLDLRNSWIIYRPPGGRCQHCLHRVYAAFVRFFGSYITFMYLFTKCLFTLNVVAQFFLLNAFLNTKDYQLYGVDVLRDLFAGREWTVSGHFPRITLCDFEVKYLGNLNRYTVQCCLMVNFVNEKIFIFLWWWFFLVACCTVSSLMFWIFNTLLGIQRSSFVAKYIYGQPHPVETGDDALAIAPTVLFDAFLNKYLRRDGIFILRMIASHAGDVIAMDITRHIWHAYSSRENSGDMKRNQKQV